MIANWDEVGGLRREKGWTAATWQPLGNAAGAKGIGLNRIRIDPGRLSTPPHSHNRAEEIFFVLAGSGLLWQDEAVCEIRAGDTIVEVVMNGNRPALLAKLDDSLLGLAPPPAGYFALRATG